MLHYLPYPWYFVGVPRLGRAVAASRGPLRQRATMFALVGYRVLVVAMLECGNLERGTGAILAVALATALLVMVGTFAAPRLLQYRCLSPPGRGYRGRVDASSSLRGVAQSLWLYLGTGAGMSP